MCDSRLKSCTCRVPMRHIRNTPEGWSFNPSEPRSRFLTACLAVAGVLIAVYIAAFQIHLLRIVWDPVFGHASSESVLNSGASRVLPIPDAALGALLYLTQTVLLLVGGERRWRDRPWATIASGTVALLLGFSGVVLIIIQPVVIGSWSLLCLGSALISWIILRRSAAELVAALQVIHERWARLQDWYIPPIRPPKAIKLHREHETVSPWFRGIDHQWHLNTCAGLGLFTLLLPWLFGIYGVGADSISIAGALALSSSLIAMSEIARPLRLINVASGALLIFWFLGEPYHAELWIAAFVGLALCSLCLYRGEIFNSYG